MCNPRDFYGVPPNFYTGSNIVDNPRYFPGQQLIPDDQDCGGGYSNFYNNHDRTTSSSTGSPNYYECWDGYQQNMSPYLQPGYNMYGGYYHGMPMHPSMLPRQASTPGYEYIHGQHFAPPSLASSRSALETVSSVGSVCSESMTPCPRDGELLKSPTKTKKGFRKVKSTNEKSLPIDPAARALILN